MAPAITIEDITPEQAVKMLEGNTNNRNVRNGRVEMYASDMASGNWKLNGVPIILNSKGGVLDGQHRLLACVRANKTFKTAVMRGVTEEAHKTIDVGLARSAADELKWRGEEYAAELAAVTHQLWRYDNDLVSKPQILASRAHILGYLKENPGVRDSIKYANRVGKALRIRSTTLAAVHYLMAREHGTAVANKWIDRIEAGTDYGEGDPCLALRNWAVNVAGTRTRPTSVEWFAIIIKAANAFLIGRPVNNYSWRRVGAKRESFPSILTHDDTGDLHVDEL